MNLIVAVDDNYAIGKENRLLFSIPDDMKHFREITSGKTVVMGRRTLMSFPGGKPLKNRRNIVLTRRADAEPDGYEICRSLDELAQLFKGADTSEVFVIGGESVYRLLLDYCEYAYITHMERKFEADTYFPRLGDGWSLYSESGQKDYEGLKYRFSVYKNSSPKQL